MNWQKTLVEVSYIYLWIRNIVTLTISDTIVKEFGLGKHKKEEEKEKSISMLGEGKGMLK